MYWDVEPYYIKFDDFKEIKAKAYLDVFNKLRARIQQMITHIKAERFENKCTLTIRRKLRKDDDYSMGFINIAVAFCLDDNELSTRVDKFRKDLVNSYVNAIDKTDNLMKVQYYEKYTPLLVQFYNGDLSDDEGIPNLYMSFNNEGFLLSTENVNIINIECESHKS
jgi:hypothetical protein